MITLTSVDVAKVLRELADRIDSGQVRPRQVSVSDDRLDMEFDTVYYLGWQRPTRGVGDPKP